MKNTINTKKRISVLLFLCAAVVVLIAGRLFYLQLLNPEYKQKMFELTRKTIQLFPTRGQITDRHDYSLAYDESAFVLYLFPDEIEDRAEIKKELQSILGMEEETIDGWLSGTGIVQADVDVNQEQADLLMAVETRGISVITQSQRHYPEGALAGSLIGFTNRDHEGTIGLEAFYDSELKGIPGKTQLFSYAGGIPVPYEQQMQYPSKVGYTYATTIDTAIQEILIEQGRIGFEKMTPLKMSILAMDPNTGEILGWADFPALDSANPRAGRTEEEKEELASLEEDDRVNKYFEMWRSFSVQDVYEPGSVFKMITAAAAFEEGTANDESRYFCDGAIHDIPGVVIRCWSYDDPHGELSFTEAMDESCNPAFVQMIRGLGKEKSREYLEAFGFGTPTGIGFPSEAEGIVPPGPEEINEATFATNSYGHGIAVTPLQMLTAVSALANGGTLMQPQIIHHVTDAAGQPIETFQPRPVRTVISESTSQRMLELLEHGAVHGTADGAHIPGYRVGGKTGTSVKFVDGSYSAESVVASYAAVFPANRPEIALLVVVDEPQDSFSGNTTAAPVAKAILEEYIRMNGLEADASLMETEEPDSGNPLTWPLDEDADETDSAE